MLQVLLEDRFKLKVHREIRQLPVYELTVAKSGLKMQASKAGSCVPYSVDSSPPPPVRTRRAPPRFLWVSKTGNCRIKPNAGWVWASASRRLAGKHSLVITRRP